MDNDAIRLRSEVGRLSLKINEQITAINLAQLELRDAATDIFQLHSYKAEVQNAAGILQNRVVEDLKTSIGQLIQIRQALEDWMNQI